jgi:hypothetical protein
MDSMKYVDFVKFIACVGSLHVSVCTHRAGRHQYRYRCSWGTDNIIHGGRNVRPPSTLVLQSAAAGVLSIQDDKHGRSVKSSQHAGL